MQPIALGSRFSLTPKPDQEGTPLRMAPWVEAFTGQHQDDAHAWPYLYLRNGEISDEQWRMPAKLDGLDGEVLCFFAFFDIDGVTQDAVFDGLSRIPKSSQLYRAAVIYFTKGGARIVYRFSSPVKVDGYGPIVRGMSLELWGATGLRVDPTTDQWHRCFRMPSVMRSDGKADGPTWTQPYWVEPMLSEDAVVDPATLPKRTERLPWAKTAQAARVDETKPDLDDQVPDSRKALYRRVLKSSRFFDYIFLQAEIQPGRRDPTLMAMAGEVVAKCYSGVAEAGPAEIFSLLLPCVLGMVQDSSESWHDKLWRLVSHCWAEQTKKEIDRKEKLALEAGQRDVTIERMLAWLPKDEIPNDPIQRALYASRHFCLSNGSGAFVVRKDGSYSNTQLRNSQLPAHFNDGLSYLSESGFRTAQGDPFDGQRILNLHSTNIDAVEYLAGLEQATRLTRVGDRHVLQVTPFALRSDLLATAALDSEIGGWLDSFSDPERLRRWLAASVALHLGGVAALYLHGPARVGKSMLAQGVADCFHAAPVPGAQAFSEFNGGLFESPVVMVDEGLPTRITGMDTADVFRSMVTGGPISVMRKHRDALTSKIPYRIIFAANSFDMVRQLIGKRTMAPQDRDAFRERILVMDTGTAPAEYLDSRGAMEFTRHSPRGSWIGNECRLARHIIRLYQIYFEENSFVRSGRLLVEGQTHPAFTLSFDLSGLGRDVVDDLMDDIARMVTGKIDIALSHSMFIEGGSVWVNRRPYVKMACRRHSFPRSDQYTLALDRFLTSQTRNDPRTMSIQQAVDLKKLVYCAQAEGASVAALQPLLIQSLGIL